MNKLHRRSDPINQDPTIEQNLRNKCAVDKKYGISTGCAMKASSWWREV
jgi:hypothetical protein